MNAPLRLDHKIGLLLARMEPLGPAGQREIIREVLAEGGSAMEAPQGAGGYCLALYGVQAIGINESDAIRQWRCLARSHIGGWERPTTDPDLRAAQIDWAAWVMSKDRTAPRRHLRTACLIIRQLSHNAILLDRARDIAMRHSLNPLT